MWGAAGMVYEVEEPDAKDPNYDESAQVRVHLLFTFAAYTLELGDFFSPKKIF